VAASRRTPPKLPPGPRRGKYGRIAALRKMLSPVHHWRVPPTACTPWANSGASANPPCAACVASAIPPAAQPPTAITPKAVNPRAKAPKVTTPSAIPPTLIGATATCALANNPPMATPVADRNPTRGLFSAPATAHPHMHPRRPRNPLALRYSNADPVRFCKISARDLAPTMLEACRHYDRYSQRDECQGLPMRRSRPPKDEGPCTPARLRSLRAAAGAI